MGESPRQSAQWLLEARAGCRTALGQLLDAERRYLLRIANHELDVELQAKGGASDLVQETFLEAHRDFEQFRGKSEAELRAWLRQLLLHRAAKNGRRYREAKKRQVGREIALHGGNSSSDREGGLAADVLSPSGQAMAAEQDQALQRAMERLSEDHRKVLHLRYREQASFEEIGQQMGRSANAARLLWSRAVDGLKQELSGNP